MHMIQWPMATEFADKKFPIAIWHACMSHRIKFTTYSWRYIKIKSIYTLVLDQFNRAKLCASFCIFHGMSIVCITFIFHLPNCLIQLEKATMSKKDLWFCARDFESIPMWTAFQQINFPNLKCMCFFFMVQFVDVSNGIAVILQFK